MSWGDAGVLAGLREPGASPPASSPLTARAGVVRSPRVEPPHLSVSAPTPDGLTEEAPDAELPGTEGLEEEISERLQRLRMLRLASLTCRVNPSHGT